jgi:hypothetical protein
MLDLMFLGLFRKAIIENNSFMIWTTGIVICLTFIEIQAARWWKREIMGIVDDKKS